MARFSDDAPVRESHAVIADGELSELQKVEFRAMKKSFNSSLYDIFQDGSSLVCQSCRCAGSHLLPVLSSDLPASWWLSVSGLRFPT